MIDFDGMDWVAGLTSKLGDVLIFLLIVVGSVVFSVGLVGSIWMFWEYVL